MPIDANRFLAKIKGESNEPPAVFGAAVMPDQRKQTATTAHLAPSAEDLNSNRVLGPKLEAATAKSLSKAP
jgi:hypothetical protein